MSDIEDVSMPAVPLQVDAVIQAKVLLILLSDPMSACKVADMLCCCALSCTAADVLCIAAEQFVPGLRASTNQCSDHTDAPRVDSTV